MTLFELFSSSVSLVHLSSRFLLPPLRRLVCRLCARFRPHAFGIKKKQDPVICLFLASFFFFLSYERRRKNFLKMVSRGEQHLSRHLLDAAPLPATRRVASCYLLRRSRPLRCQTVIGCGLQRKAERWEPRDGNCVRLAVWP